MALHVLKHVLFPLPLLAALLNPPFFLPEFDLPPLLIFCAWLLASQFCINQ